MSGKEKSSRLRADTLASSMVILLVVMVVQRSIGFGRGILFCRWLSPETLGQWEMAYSFLLLAAPLAVLGIPGSFGRYLERYRQRGHLRTFLRRTIGWTAICGIASVTIVIGLAPQFSQLLFGTMTQVRLIHGIALCLGAIIFHHTVTSLLIALRLFRVVSVMNFFHSLLFAGLALGMMTWNAHVSSVLIGYGVASVVASLGSVIWIGPELRQVEKPVDDLPHLAFWPRMMRFAFFVWLTNMLSHLFAIVDRYMILHFSGLPASEALEQVGYYHSSRIIPLLLVSFADMLSGMILPHFSNDWEAGRRQEVGLQLKFFVKMTCLGMMGFGIVVLLLSPFLFDVVLAGKYAHGLTVLPWTLAACMWYGIFLIAQNYLWCAEHARLAALPLAIGLVANICLNALLLPWWGLYGAVVATAMSTLVCLMVIFRLSQKHGFSIDLGLWFLAFFPLVLPLGGQVALLSWLAVLLIALKREYILSEDEQSKLWRIVRENLEKVARRLPWGPTTPKTTSP